MNDPRHLPLTASHWGVYRAEVADGRLEALHPFEHDPDPSPIGQGYLGVLDDPLRIRAPMIRKSWLENGPGAATEKRGEDPFIQVSWEKAEKLVADELERISSTHGNQAIYGGSYGWSGAGRFHHAQSQLHRFLNCLGGYTRSVNSYSLAAGEVILPHILGEPTEFFHTPPSWQSVIDNTELLVAFGGLPVRNSQISSGGLGAHRAGNALSDAKRAAVNFVNISPIRSDVAEELSAEWIAPRPGSDVALMLSLAHELLINGWHDQAFLDRYTTGFAQFSNYVLGKSDGIAKTVTWAAEIAGVSGDGIANLAARMAKSRTLISVSWALTRQEHGEQSFWAATVLAAMLGQIGLPGGGIAFGYCAANSVGMEKRRVNYAAFPKKTNAVKSFIPVARISDMLLKPGDTCRYNGQTLTYPDIRLIYWAGGNPFHHHQDLTRLCRAWQKPETVIVNEWCWNAMAKRADIVLPCTTQLERRDVMITPRDPYMILMEAVVEPFGASRNDFDIFRGISKHLGIEAEFTEGRSADDWVRWIYDQSREKAKETGVDLPRYEAFAEKGWHFVEPDPSDRRMDGALAEFRDNPERHPLNTPSGRIEICSKAIASFGEDGIFAHPAWYTRSEWLGNADTPYQFHLISSQPSDKLHSQLDHGPISRAAKVNGRTPVSLNPQDAEAKGIQEGDLVRLFNDRGACLAAAKLDAALMQGVIVLSTGAWLDAVPQSDGTLMCRAGNPNTLTRDHGTSALAQGPTAHSCLVDFEKFGESDEGHEAFIPPDQEFAG